MAARKQKAPAEAFAEDLRKSRWKVPALKLGLSGATLVTGDVTCNGDTHPVLEASHLDGKNASHTLEASVQGMLEYIAGFLVDDVNPRIPQPRRGFPTAPFSPDEVMAILDMLLEQVNDCAEAETLRGYLRLTERLGYYATEDGSWVRVSRSRYELFRSLLQFDHQALCEVIGEALLDSLSMSTAPEGVVFFAGDESLVPGGFGASGNVLRKPLPQGVRVFVVGGCLTSTGRPVVVSVLPAFDVTNATQTEVGNGVHRPADTLEKVRMWYVAHKERLPQHVWVAVDSPFSCPAMLKAWEADGLHGSMALSKDLYEPYAVLRQRLAPQCSRIIDVGSLVVSVYGDKQLVATAATGFSTNTNAPAYTPTVPMPPLVGPAGAFCLWLMEQLSPHDLEFVGALLNRKAEAEGGQDATYSLTHQPNHMADCLTAQQLQFVLRVTTEALQRKDAEEAQAGVSMQASHGDFLRSGATLADQGAAAQAGAGQGTSAQARAGQGTAGDKRAASEPAGLAPPRKKRKAVARDSYVHRQLIPFLKARNFAYSDRSRVAKAKDVLQLAKAEDIDVSACQGEEEVAAAVLKAMIAQEEQTRERGEEAEREEVGSKDSAPELPYPEVFDSIHGVGWKDKIPSVEDIKAKFTVEQLAPEIRRLYPGAAVTRSKDMLASQLRSILIKRATDPTFALQCLTSTESLGKSPLACFHGDIAYAVVNFDFLLSSLASKYTGTSQTMHLLRWLVRMVFIQCHSLHEDSHWTHRSKEWHAEDQEECTRQKQIVARAHKAYIAARKAKVRAAWAVRKE